MASGFNLDNLPMLRVDTSNVPGSWHAWRTDYEICGEMTQLRMGIDYRGDNKLTRWLCYMLFK